MAIAVHALEVRLAGTFVGHLSKAGHVHRFTPAASYLDAPERPTLSQQFIGATENETRLRLASDRGRHVLAFGRLPPFFANLLPEGPLRGRLIGARAVGPEYEFDLLAAVGANLPGALDVRPALDAPAAVLRWHEQLAHESARFTPTEAPIPEAFSLAGSQDKRLMVERSGEFVPAPAGEGDWVAKLPDARRPGAAANEATVAELAAAAGVATAAVRLASLQLVGLASADAATIDPAATEVLLARRVDRADGARVHVEDFAQVLGRYPEDKYSSDECYETLARVLYELAPRRIEEALELVRRLVVSVLAGNAALHLKNIAVRYGAPGGRALELAPAFDLGTSLQWADDERLALAIAGSRDMRRVDAQTFARFAARAGLPPKAVQRCVRDTVKRARASWPKILFGAPMDTESKRRLLGRLAQLPLAA